METLNNLSQICEAVCTISREVGKFIRLEQSRLTDATIEDKGLNDFVTYVDKAAESLLVRELKALLPEAGFITEENTVAQEEKEFKWIIDPIDGTTNFIHGLPLFCISIALMHNQTTVLGVVYEMSRDECFHAITGRNSYLNTSPIRVSKRKLIKDSLIVTGFPYKDEGVLEQWVSLFTYFIRNSHGIRRLGSAAIDLAYVACGRFEAFYENGLAPWDVAAGAFIVQQADGAVSDFSGGNNYIFGKELVAGNGFVNHELIQCIHSKVDL